MALPVNGSTHLIPVYYAFYRPRKDERLSWPSWLTCSGWLTHTTGHPSAAGRAQDRESSPARDRRSTTVPRHQLNNGSVRNVTPATVGTTSTTTNEGRLQSRAVLIACRHAMRSFTTVRFMSPDAGKSSLYVTR